jgi:hypothetical protein
MPADLAVWHNRRDTLLRILDVPAEGRAQTAALLSARQALREGEPTADDEERARRVAEAAVEECEHADAPPATLLGDKQYYSVSIPVGISPGTLGRHNITVEYSIDLPYPFESDRAPLAARQREEARGEYARIGLDTNNRLGHIRRITPDFIAHLRYLDPGRPGPNRVRPYLEMSRVFEALATTPERRPAYYEAVLHYVPAGARLRYRIKVYAQSREPNVIPPQTGGDSAGNWYSVYVTAPTFTFDDIQYCPPRASTADVNVAYWRTDVVSGRTLLTFRFDFYDVRRAINDFSLAFARPGHDAGPPSTLTYAWFYDGTSPGAAFADLPISSTWHLGDLAVVNHQFDYVTLTLPLDTLVEGERVFWRGQHIATVEGGKLVAVTKRATVPVRLMFIHYANQSLNDMFESPNRSYDPPRTYLQTTMYDELGTYSSRPTSNETGVGDGYGYVIEGHLRTELPCLFSLNGGFLSMLAQDAPGFLPLLKRAIKKRLFEPAIGGFAGHRMLYFRQETNRQAIQRGIDMIQNMLGHTGRVFYPNSRLYAQVPNIDGPILDAEIRKPMLPSDGTAPVAGANDGRRNRIQFVVVDEPAFAPFREHPPLDHPHDLWGDHEYSYIWRQRCAAHRGSEVPCSSACTTWYWLFISGKMKDDLLGASDDEWQAGKLSGNLRQHFFYGVSQPNRVRDLVHVYSDDADKAAGNGWFDGDFGGVERHWAAIFAAALEWIAAHPWLQVVTASQLDPDRECLGTIDLRQAIDPFIHRDAADVTPNPTFWSDQYQGENGFDDWAEIQQRRFNGNLGFEFARWYVAWRDTPAIWLKRSLGEIASTVERVVMKPAVVDSSNELVGLAQLGFMIGIHEAAWSKKPLEGFIPRADFDAGKRASLSAYQRQEVLEPENFVLAQTLQMRNAHVFLCAARWAHLLASPEAYDPADTQTYKNTGPLVEHLRSAGTGAWKLHQPRVRPELQWDLDITENVILYNRHLLVVLDSNGGRITHIFAADDNGTPYVVSGNIKAYQFLGNDRTYGGTLNCNGSVIQNTVSVANHRYVASDVTPSLAQAGTRFNPKTRVASISDGGGSWRVEDGAFGDEDWLYPDNFNMYAPCDAGADASSAGWRYPGRTWRLSSPTSATFDRTLAEYRDWILDGAPDDQFRDRRPPADEPAFTKTIRLVENRIEISYAGDIGPGHRVANELSLDLYRMVMCGQRQTRAWVYAPGYVPGTAAATPADVTGCTVTAANALVSAEVALGTNCRFSDDTLKGASSLRLHRAFSDCLEIESIAGGPFSYTIDVTTRTPVSDPGQ